MYENLLFTIEKSVCTISLNRPDVYNALNEKITMELQDALKKAETDDSIRVVVLTGNGKAFSSGADLKEGINGSFSDVLNKRYHPIILSIRNMPKPVLCRLNGIAAGAGCSLALACDLIIASEEAVLTELFISIGLVMDAGSTYFLPKLVGTSKAFELATTGRKVTAAEAASIGLVNKTVPADKLDDAILELTSYYASAPTKTIGLIKKLLNQSSSSSLEEVLELEAKNQDIAGNSKDFMIGVQAFLTKTKPEFIGK